MAKGNHLTLFLPDLLAADAAHVGALEQSPACPSLERLVSRAERNTVDEDIDRALFRQFGMTFAPEQDVPVAAVLADKAGDAYWLCADPVHLQPGNDELVLAGWGELGLSLADAQSMADEINALFAENGWHLAPLTAQRWLLRLRDIPTITTRPLRAVQGQPIGRFLPQGEDAAQWRVWMNEVQMILHQSAVNRERQQSGKTMINSLWFWGGGRLPAMPPAHWRQVLTNEALAQSLARHAPANAGSLPSSFNDLTFRDHQLLVFPEHGRILDGSDFEAWLERIEHFERDWFAPALKALQDGGLQSLTLLPGNGSAYRCDRKGLKRWWRRVKPLSAFLR